MVIARTIPRLILIFFEKRLDRFKLVWYDVVRTCEESGGGENMKAKCNLCEKCLYWQYSEDRSWHCEALEGVIDFDHCTNYEPEGGDQDRE